MKVLVLALVLAGCAKDAHDLSPFPCADDLTCPAGLACAGNRCVAAALDAICTTGEDPTDCAMAGPGAVCSRKGSDGLDIGACELPCGGGCPTGRRCNSSGVDGVCLLDCEASASACPPNMVCLPAEDGHKVCTPPSIGCRQVSNMRRCTSRFCESRSTAVDCPDGLATCPAQSTCSSNSRDCTCTGDLIAVACDNDTECTDNSPCGGNRHWWCAPEFTASSCAADLTDQMGTCECWKGTIAIDCDRQGVTCDELCRDL